MAAGGGRQVHRGGEFVARRTYPLRPGDGEPTLLHDRTGRAGGPLLPQQKDETSSASNHDSSAI